jgi:thiol:disulfide interchange protein
MQRSKSKSQRWWFLVLVAACGGSASLLSCAKKAPPAKLELSHAPAEGEVSAVVRSELLRASQDGRQLLVYVGATWCEPCKRFHRAAESGQLDAHFPSLRLLEFDFDRDGERLRAAGYTSRYIPLFARPGKDGRASGRQIEGSVKGEGAVGNIAPRLNELLDGG